MFEKMRKKMAENMGRTVKEAAIPLQNEIKETMDGKVDLYSKILKLGLLIILFIEGGKRVSKMDEVKAGPSQIVINNYITQKEDEDRNDRCK